jgi:arsenite-transporting ATPase
VRLVVPAEDGAAAALREAAAVLGLFGYRQDAVVVNRLVPDEVDAPFFEPVKARQAAMLEEVRGDAGTPVVSCAWRAEPPSGEAPLLDLAREAYGESDPCGFMGEGEPWAFAREGGGYVLRVAVPFASRQALRLEQAEDGIIVHLNGRRRLFPLPGGAAGLEASTWSHDGRVLKVTLE